MSKLSRVKKNQEIYENLSKSSNNDEIIDASLEDYSQRINEDSVPKDQVYQASRRKKNRDYNKEPFNKPKQDILADKDLLAEFIDEVKEYNIQRGLRKVNDTQVNILKNLGKVDDLEDSSENFIPIAEENEISEVEENDQSVFTLDEDQDQELTKEIETIMQNMSDDPYRLDEELEEEAVEETFEEATLQSTEELSLDDILRDETSEEVSKVDDIEFSEKEDEKNELLMDTEEYEDDSLYEMITEEIKLHENEEKKHERLKKEREDELLELTQTLSLQLEDYETELDDVNNKVGALDRILTVFVFILILILISIISVVAYWILKERGIF